MDAKAYIDSLIEKARVAQAVIEGYDQAKTDQCVKVVGKALADRAEELAEESVVESKMGVYEDKIAKIRNKAMFTWKYLKGKPSVGIIERDKELGITKVAKPIGVIGAITPVTNPVMTPMHNAMIALKGRNAIIICPHPSAKNVGYKSTEIMRAALKEIGAPEDLIQCVEPDKVTMEASAAVMGECDVCVATGGPGMVKAAYSSGKPAFGVGAGNNQCLIDTDADPVKIAPMIVTGRTQDNGVLCTCEQTIIVPEGMYDTMIAEMEKNNVQYYDKKEDIDKLRETLFPGGELNKKCVGMLAGDIAKLAGLECKEGTRALMAACDVAGVAEDLSKEKLFPVIAAYKYKTWEEGVDIVVANLDNMGKGHSISMHSFNDEHIEYAANRVHVSRFLVNGIGSAGLGGAATNNLVPTGTLGCGTWGGNSISENLAYYHLINVSRIAYTDESMPFPNPDEVWAD